MLMAQLTVKPKPGEAERVCPECGGRWKQKSGEGRGMDWFDFRCEPCRLVSHLASTTEDERHARIGEYRKKR